MSFLTFPILDHTGIMEFFNNIDFMFDAKVTRKDFTHPEVLRWRTIYASFFEHIYNVDVETVIQRSKLERPVIPFQEIYDDGVALCTFAKLMRQLLEECLLPDFSLQDITEVNTEKRLVTIVSALINFCKFKITRERDLLSVEKEHEAGIQQVSELKQANDVLRQQNDNLLKQRADDEESCLQVREENLEMIETMKQKQSYEEVLQAQYQDNMAQLSLIDRQNEKLMGKLAEATKLCESLQSKIVSSPEEYRKSVTRLEDEKMKMGEEQLEQKERFRSAKQHGEEVRETVDVLEEAIGEIGVVDGGIESLRLEKLKLNQAKKRQADTQKYLQDLGTQVTEEKEKLEKSQELYAKLKHQHERKIASLEHSKVEYLKRKDVLKTQCNETSAAFNKQKNKITEEKDAKLREAFKQIENWKAQTQKAVKAFDVSMDELTQDWNALLDEFGLSGQIDEPRGT